MEEKFCISFFPRIEGEEELYYRSSLSRVIVPVNEIFLQLYKFPYGIPSDRDFIGFKSGELRYASRTLR